MKIAVIGASGYSGEELIRLLSQHPKVELCSVTSRSLSGKKVGLHFPALADIVGDLEFSESSPTEIANQSDIDLVFLALPHGVSFEYAEPLVKASKMIIDLSADFRLHSSTNYKKYYDQDHPASHLLDISSYVLPELADNDLKEDELIACPGCYPTSILIPVLPLIKSGVIDDFSLVINSYSGVSGAGREKADLLLKENQDSLTAYGLPKHRHVSEIKEQLEKAACKDVNVQFCPHLAPFPRGIHTTIVVPTKKDIDEVYTSWENNFIEAPFVKILPSGTFPKTKDVIKTNNIEFSAVIDPDSKNLIITSVIDNLLKGASGQAIQIFNKKFGFSETMGIL